MSQQPVARDPFAPGVREKVVEENRKRRLQQHQDLAKNMDPAFPTFTGPNGKDLTFKEYVAAYGKEKALKKKPLDVKNVYLQIRELDKKQLMSLSKFLLKKMDQCGGNSVLAFNEWKFQEFDT